MDKPDQLRELFRMQKALNERIGVRTEAMAEPEKIRWLLNYCRAMTQEIAELTDSVPPRLRCGRRDLARTRRRGRLRYRSVPIR